MVGCQKKRTLPKAEPQGEREIMTDEITLRREASGAATALLLIRAKKHATPSVVSSLEGGVHFCDFVLAGVKYDKAGGADKLSYEDFETIRFATRLSALESEAVQKCRGVRQMLLSVLKKLKRNESPDARQIEPAFGYFDHVTELMLIERRYADLARSGDGPTVGKA
jgi:hypothetical protein